MTSSILPLQWAATASAVWHYGSANLPVLLLALRVSDWQCQWQAGGHSATGSGGLSRATGSDIRLGVTTNSYY